MRIRTGLIRKSVKKPTLLQKGRFFLVLTFLYMPGFHNSIQAQSDVFKSIGKQYELGAELYFYASTLRMININRDPNFDEMIEDIKKMTFYQVNDFPISELKSFSKKFRDEEGFEELMTIEGKQQTLYILGKDEDEFIALLKTDEGVVAVDIMGMIRIDKIPDLINSFKTDNFLNVFEVGKSERNEHGN